MKKAPENELEKALAWCTSKVGQVKIMSDKSKTHGGHESGTYRLAAANGFYFLKVHQTLAHWQQEVHAYEKWAGAFSNYAPSLIAAHDESPLALLISELPGQVLDDTQLTPSQEQAAWQAAGQTLAALHDLTVGACFGPCLRSGTCTESFPKNAEEYIYQRFTRQIDRAVRAGYIKDDELDTLQAVLKLIPAFAGESPRPCHRDYCAANWLVSPAGTFTGVIDFEFAHWDVRVADFSRDPNWSWIHRPDLLKAFFGGYGRILTPAEEQQLLVAHAEYALSAIIWGHDVGFYGFEREGRDALGHIASFVL